MDGAVPPQTELDWPLLPASVRAWLGTAEHRSLSAEQLLATPGVPPDGVLFVFSGRVAVRRASPDSEELQPVTELIAGDWLNSACDSNEAPEPERWPFVVRATSEARVALLPSDELRELVARAGELGLWRNLEYPALRRLTRSLLRHGARVDELRSLLSRLTVRHFDSARELSTDDLRPACLHVVVAGGVQYGSCRLMAGDTLGLHELLLARPMPFSPRVERTARIASVSLVGLASVECALRDLAVFVLSNGQERGWLEPTELGDSLQAAPEASEEEDDLPGPRARRSWRAAPGILQRADNDCAVACLCMLLEAHGADADYEWVRARAKVTKYGTTLADLEIAARSVGFKTSALRVSYEALATLDLPLIVHLHERQHYAVLWRASARGVTIADPAHGVSRLSASEFQSCWEGVVLAVAPTAEVRELVDATRVQRVTRQAWLVRLVARYRKSWTALAVAALAIAALELVTPLVTQTSIDQLMASAELRLTWAAFAVMSAVTTSLAVLRIARDRLVTRVGVSLEASLLDDLYTRLVEPRNGLAARFNQADLLARFGDVTTVRSFLADSLVNLVVDGLLIVPGLLLLFQYSPLLTGAFVSSLAITLTVAALANGSLNRALVRYRILYDRQRQQLLDTISGIETVVFQALSREFTSWMRDLLRPTVSASRDASYRAKAQVTLVGWVSGVLGSGLLLLGIRQVMQGVMSWGEFVAFGMLTTAISAPFLRIMDEWSRWQQVKISLSRVSELVGAGAERQPETRLTLPRLSGHIEFKDVSFRYDGDPRDRTRPAVDGLGFSLLPGQVIGVVGRSGSGKSTLVKLLLGLLQPTHGAVLMDGVRTSDLDSEALLRKIGYVSQNAHIFSSTLYQNIACGRALSDEAVIRAAQLAGAYDFISELPYGLATRVGSRGVQLSGGERQRLVLARALAGDPGLLVLDEATAALDTIAEQAIFERLQDFARGRTTVIITHRIATLRHVDRVVVLESGKLAEIGSPDELLQKAGLFRQLFEAAPRWEVA